MPKKPFTPALEIFGNGQKTQRHVGLGFIKLGKDKRPKQNKRYPIVNASDEYLDTLEFPQDAEIRKLDLNIFELYIDDLPDFTKHNEGLLKVTVNTKNPQDLDGSENDVSVATNFAVKDKNYAPNFLYKGIFKNVLFNDFVHIKLDLFELDSDSSEYFEKVKTVINGIPEVANLDILKGIPYANLATNLFESVINVFGKNPDDQIWAELPQLDLEPTIGGAFLRNGIYVLYETKNSKKQTITPKKMEYLNEKIVFNKSEVIKEMSNHLIFGVKISKHK